MSLIHLKDVIGSSGKILDIMEARIYKETPEAETRHQLPRPRKETERGCS